MPTPLHHHRRRQEGFTLIELLVVILIIGILAAVAIPTFLSQTSKATDSGVLSVLGTAHTTEATYRVANSSYTNSVSALAQLEPSLTTPATTDNMAISFYAATGVASATTGYQISATSPKTSVVYTLKYDAASGAVLRTCSTPNTGVCSATSTWGS